MKKALYILAELSDRDFDWLISTGRKRVLPEGTVLIREGEATDALYIVLDGLLSVCTEALEGQEVAQLSSGELVGEMSFVDARPPSATVRAIQTTVVWSIPRVQLAAKLSQDVGFAAHFYQALAVLLSDRLRSTVDRLGHPKDAEVETSDPSPKLLNSIEIAKVRLDWLLNRLKGVG
jgi:CRP-like cAMP-binding protein